MAAHAPMGDRDTSREVSTAKLLETLGQHRDEFLGFLNRRTGSGVDAEDVLQQALLLATRKVANLRQPELLVPWFYRILRRTLADDYARSTSRTVQLRTLAMALGSATMGENEMTCSCSLGLLDSLPPQYSDLLRRVDLGEEPVDAVAASLGTTVNNVTVRLHRARKALRGRLQAFCGTTSSRTCLDCSCGTI
jgi:DNA-directed RNA polymerase specialized sigma24 family protein